MSTVEDPVSFFVESVRGKEYIETLCCTAVVERIKINSTVCQEDHAQHFRPQLEW